MAKCIRKEKSIENKKRNKEESPIWQKGVASRYLGSFLSEPAMKPGVRDQHRRLSRTNKQRAVVAASSGRYEVVVVTAY